MSTSTPPTLIEFRADADACRTLVEKLYPDDQVRKACLEQLAKSIQTANAISSSGWGITLHDTEIRLNVGYVETLVLRKNALHLTIQKPLNDAEWLQVTQAPGLQFKWNGKPFKSIESAYGVILDTNYLETLLPLVAPLHLSLVKTAAQGVRTLTNFHKSHSPGVTEYLRDVIDDGLPNPGYYADEATTSEATRRYWKISPGGTRDLWDEFQQDGVIRGDWRDSPDLGLMEAKSPQELRHWLNETNPSEQFSPAYADQMWKFYHELAAGDLVCAYRNKTIFGLGEIIGAYEYDEAAIDFRHRRAVNWFEAKPSATTPLPDALTQRLQQHANILELTAAEFSQIEHLMDLGMTYEVAPGRRAKIRHDSNFDAIMLKLDAAGLYFSSEVVSNYLLALQTKRFVILTGISGTGKTQLALAVAKHFRQSVTTQRIAKLPAGALEVVVKPTNLKYGLLLLPTTFVVGLDDPPIGGREDAKKIRIEYPDGEQMLTLSKAADYNVTRLFFSGAFRKWFLESFNVGDHFAVEIVESNNEDGQSLRFHLPSVSPSLELLPNYEVSAVRPDWSDNRGLLGYFNPLIGIYVVTPFLRLMLDASDEVERAKREAREPAPFFVILDEMNLARVEHYFSDFLSALESGEPIPLHDHAGIEEGETNDAVAVPRQLRIPENIYFTGTVNVDETTYMFSPKVLDRAFTIELNQVDLATFGNGNPEQSIDFALHRFPGQLGPSPKPNTADWVEFRDLLDGALRQVVLDLHELLSEEDRHFGYRVANEIARFVVLASEQTNGTEGDLWTALDLAILEKILPKFHGTQQELDAALSGLIAFIEVRALPRTLAKLKSMQRRLRRQGFTSFIE